MCWGLSVERSAALFSFGATTEHTTHTSNWRTMNAQSPDTNPTVTSRVLAQVEDEKCDPNEVYAWCPSDFYCCMIGDDYRITLEALVKTGILEQDIVYDGWERYRVLRLAPQFRKGHSLRPISIATVDEKVSHYYRSISKYYDPVANQIGEHLALKFPRINLDEDQIKAILKMRYWDKYLPMHPITYKYRPMREDEYVAMSSDLMEVVDKWNGADHEEKVAMCHADPFGNRVHHIFSRLPKDFRAHLVDVNGEPISLVECDMSNAQATLFANILVTQHGVSRGDPFIQLVEETRIYKDLAERLKKDVPRAKIEMMRFMFCKADKVPQRRFEKFYPTPAKFARQYKTMETDLEGKPIPEEERYKYLCKILQRAERSIFEPVWMKLLHRGVSFIPVHDAIYISENDRKKQLHWKHLIENTIAEKLKINFKIKGPEPVE